VRVAVEGLGATIGPADGAGRYLLGLLGALARRDDVWVTAYVGPSMRDAVKGLGLGDVVVVSGGRSRRLLAQHLTVPRSASRKDVDAVLYLGNYAPVRSGPPAISLVANLLLAVEDPAHGISAVDRGLVAGWRSTAFGRARARYRKFARGQLVRRAEVIVANSRTLAQALEAAEPRLKGRVRVVRPPYNVAELLAASAARARETPAEYFLAVGRPWAYRDYPLALEALAESGLPHALVVLGEAPPEERTTLEQHAQRLGLDGRLQFAGLVHDPRLLRGWYEGASALVGTSRIEAYPYPPGEAMVLGTPVVAVRRTAYPEVVGDGGLLVEPTTEDLARGLCEAVRPEERARLVERGRRWVGALTWDDCVAQLLDICREVAPAVTRRG
jgi:glycosyltransferase involved in cell wall biosynthesis